MIRCVLILIFFLALTLVLLPFQLVGLMFRLPIQRTIPHWYHRLLCAVIGIRIREIGKRSEKFPLLILSNHASWLDIVATRGPPESPAITASHRKRDRRSINSCLKPSAK